MNEEQFLSKTYTVIKQWKIGRFIMRIGDPLDVVDYGSGLVSNYLVFVNTRLPGHRFHTGTWYFEQNTKLK